MDPLSLALWAMCAPDGEDEDPAEPKLSRDDMRKIITGIAPEATREDMEKLLEVAFPEEK